MDLSVTVNIVLRHEYQTQLDKYLGIVCTVRPCRTLSQMFVL